MRIIFFILSVWLPFSCATQKKEVIAKSIIKLEGKNTNIRDLIEIDGYFFMSEYPQDNCIIFFEDGTCVQFSFKRNAFENEIKANISKSVAHWKEGKKSRWGSYWAVYKIEKDTLVVYQYDPGSFWKGWSFNEIRYIVINRETIHRVYFKGLFKSDEAYYKSISPWVAGNEYFFHFSPSDTIPSSDCWLKEEKWIWRNESDWKEYMEKMEQKEKEYKDSVTKEQ